MLLHVLAILLRIYLGLVAFVIIKSKEEKVKVKSISLKHVCINMFVYNIGLI